MKNFTLNPGGIIGAIAGGGIGAAIIFSLVSTDTNTRGPFKLIILALIGGAIAGNFLWQLVFKKDPEKQEEERA